MFFVHTNMIDVLCAYKHLGDLNVRVPGPNFMALLTVSTESALTEAGNSVLTRVSGKFWLLRVPTPRY